VQDPQIHGVEFYPVRFARLPLKLNSLLAPGKPDAIAHSSC
jgi:hypothetical protein